MSNHKISTLSAISLISSPIALSAETPFHANGIKTVSSTPSLQTISQRSSVRKMLHLLATPSMPQSMNAYVSELQIADQEARIAFQYLLDEVALDAALSNEEQQAKVKDFEIFAGEVSSEAAPQLMKLILEETRARILNILQNAAMDDSEVNARLADWESAILGVQNMTVEIARQMLFFVAELNIHRQYVYEYGVALGCPAKQLLRHDLSKLSAEQFEGYARYFRGGKKEIDRPRYLAAWGFHQYEEHHHESYQKEEFSFVGFTDERIRNNMFESVADLLAAAKQRGGHSTIDWLVNVFPKHKPHYRLIPFFQEALIKAHALYLEAEKNPDLNSIFKGFPSWNEEIEEILKQCALSPDEEINDHGSHFHFCSPF